MPPGGQAPRACGARAGGRARRPPAPTRPRWYRRPAPGRAPERPRGPDPLRLPAPRGAHRTRAELRLELALHRERQRIRAGTVTMGTTTTSRDSARHRQVAQLAAVDQRAVPGTSGALAPARAPVRGPGARPRMRTWRRRRLRSTRRSPPRARAPAALPTPPRAVPVHLGQLVQDVLDHCCCQDRPAPGRRIVRRGAASRWRSSSREGSLRSSSAFGQPIRRANSITSFASRARLTVRHRCRSAAARCPSSWPGRSGCRDRPPCRPRPRVAGRDAAIVHGVAGPGQERFGRPFNERPPTSGLTATTGASVSARASRIPGTASIARARDRVRGPITASAGAIASATSRCHPRLCPRGLGTPSSGGSEC